MQIAVDGPAGSGKSTISKVIAKKYGLVYLDTGAMYRSVAWLSITHNIPLEEISNLVEKVKYNFFDNGNSLRLIYNINNQNFETDVSKVIRTPEVTKLVSAAAANPDVRKVLTKKQQEIAASSDVIMDGRDIGTTVLPNANIKFYLTATPEERAKRRALEWGINLDGDEFANLLKDIIKRDNDDSTRAVSPLKKADDAKEIDTTHLTMDEVIEIMGAVVIKYRQG